MTRFTIIDLPLEGLKRVQRKPLQDARGLFERIFCADELAAIGWTGPIAQINHSVTHLRGSVRGMHYQCSPHAEMKLVSCLRGEVWDVAVDVRAGSPTFLQWHAERLSAGNARSLLIPPGFAHGLQAQTNDAELLYLHSAAYTPGSEAILNPMDPLLALPWPLPVGEMSERDRSHAFLTQSFEGVHL